MSAGTGPLDAGRSDDPVDHPEPAGGAAHRAARALLTWAVRGRSAHGTEWGEAMLRELDEVDGGRQRLRWAVSGAWTAWRDRLRHLPESRMIAAVPRPLRPVVSVLATFLVTLGALTLVNHVALSVSYIPSGSMEPTLAIGDRVLVDRIGFRITGLEYGDIVTFTRDDGVSTDKTFIKRVVGLPGDVMSCAGGHLTRNGDPVDESYLPAGTVTAAGVGERPAADCQPVTVPDGEIFVLGDHREISIDSRTFGSVREDAVEGRVLGTIWS
ncbi:signal peptidase I [Luedemannella flava]